MSVLDKAPVFRAPPAAFDLLAAAEAGLAEASAAPAPADRYAAAHLAALRGAAAVLAAKARPNRGRRRLRSAWDLLIDLAPELGEWAVFFAAGAKKRAAAEAGIPHAVSVREADDLVRDVDCFLSQCASTLGLLR